MNDLLFMVVVVVIIVVFFVVMIVGMIVVSVSMIDFSSGNLRSAAVIPFTRSVSR